MFSFYFKICKRKWVIYAKSKKNFFAAFDTNNIGVSLCLRQNKRNCRNDTYSEMVCTRRGTARSGKSEQRDKQNS